MLNREIFSGGTGEDAGESMRSTYEERGERTLEAENEAKIKELLEERDRLVHELADLEQQESSLLEEREALQREMEELDANDGERITEEEARASYEKAKKNKIFMKIAGAAALISTVAALAVGGWMMKSEFKNQPAETESIVSEIPEGEMQQHQAEMVAESDVQNIAEENEKETTKLSYDYSHWSDFENKSSHNAFDYDYSERHGNIEKTKEGILEVGARTPEALGAYSYLMFTDAEKDELGIAGMSASEIDDYMSDESHEDAGEMQQRLLKGLEKVFNDEGTSFDFYYENDTEMSNYIYLIDENGDGNYTPIEMHLGQSQVKRNGAPQVDVYRLINGQRVKMADLNEYCGYQPNFEINYTMPGVKVLPKQETSAAAPTVVTPAPVVTPVAPAPAEVVTPTPEPEPTPTPTPEPTPTPTPEPEPEPTPTPTPTPDQAKDAANLERIDNQIMQDIAEDVGVRKIEVEQVSSETVENQERTDKPADEAYEGTEATIVQNEASTQAEPVQEQISQENNYGEDLGGANAAEFAPVQENNAADQQAAAAERTADNTTHAEDAGSFSVDDLLNLE